MNDKKIYELLNNVELNFQEIEDTSEIEKERLKRNFKNRNNKKNNIKMKNGILVACLALLVGFSSQTKIGHKVYAIAESKLNEISYSIGESLNIDKDIDSYVNIIDKVVESNEIGIKITDIIVDKDELLISNLIDINNFESKEDVVSVFFEEKVFINGKRIKNIGSSGSIGKLSNEKNIYSDIRSIDIKDINLEEDLNIKIIYDDFHYYDSKYKKTYIKGKWKYEFKGNGLELQKSTISKKLDYNFNIENGKIKLNEIRLNPVNKKIYGEIIKSDGKDYDIKLKGYDDLGNDIVFYLSKSYDHKLILNQGNLDSKISDEIKYLKLTPYAVEFPEKNGKLSDDFKKVGEEFTIEIYNETK